MKRIILDTNLLVLLVVGLADEKLISKHKRIQKNFMLEDFELLKLFLEPYQQIVVTPHILAETSNLVSLIGDPDKSRIMRILGAFIGELEEIQHPSKSAVNSPHFVRLGLTDCMILEILQEDLPLLTVDFDLYFQALSSGRDVFNFNHLRQEYLWSS
jgi:hypothetical protein